MDALLECLAASDGVRLSLEALTVSSAEGSRMSDAGTGSLLALSNVSEVGAGVLWQNRREKVVALACRFCFVVSHESVGAPSFLSLAAWPGL